MAMGLRNGQDAGISGAEEAASPAMESVSKGIIVLRLLRPPSQEQNGSTAVWVSLSSHKLQVPVDLASAKCLPSV